MTDQIDPVALVKAALERAAALASSQQWDDEPPYFQDYDEYFGDIPLDPDEAIRVLADDPKAVAQIIEQVKGESDE